MFLKLDENLGLSHVEFLRTQAIKPIASTTKACQGRVTLRSGSGFAPKIAS